MSQMPQPIVRAGLIGAGIQLSRTPALHEHEGAAQGLRYSYRLIDLEQRGLGVAALPDLLAEAERANLVGVNITHPCKQVVIPLLDDLSDEARALGAVNTVVLRGGRRVGHNTDWWGFAENVRRGLPDVALHRVALFGAGGAGAAVAHAALALGVAHLAIVDVEPARAQALAVRLAEQFGRARVLADTDAARAVAEADGIINSTPVGMANYPGTPLPVTLLRPAMWVADIVYFPLETELLRAARALGCRTLDGGGMAVFQAVEAFRLFTGLQADADRMLRHFAQMGAP